MNKKRLIPIIYSLLLLVVVTTAIFILNSRKALPKYPNYVFTTQTTKSIESNKLQGTVWAWKKNKHGYEYKVDLDLCGIALFRARQIRNDWSHDGFKDIKEVRYQMFPQYYRMGENLIHLTIDSPIPESMLYPMLLDKWLESPTHAKMLNEDFKYSCIQCESNYCVQIFAK